MWFTDRLQSFRQFLDDLEVSPLTPIGLESGQQCRWVSRILASMEMKPIVVDAREVRAKARRIGQKSDKRDAFEICDGIRRDIYTAIVYIPDPDIEHLRVLCSRRRHFVKISTMQINAAKYILRAQGLSKIARTLRTKKAWQKLLNNPDIASLRGFIELHYDMWELAQNQIGILEDALHVALEPFEETNKRLQTMSGVGPITAATFIAVIADPHRFPRSKEIVSYIGLAPSTYDTGDRERHGRITKRGSSELRSMLCEAAHSAAKPSHPLNPYFRRVSARSGYRKAVVCVAHRIARILYQMWRNGEDFDVQKLNVALQVKAAKKTIRYHIGQAVS